MTNENGSIEGDAPRWLRLLVYIMGAALVAGFIILVGGIAYKASNYKPTRVASTAQLLDLNLGGEEVQHMALDGDRLAVKTPTQIIIIDLRDGKEISRMNLK